MEEDFPPLSPSAAAPASPALRARGPPASPSAPGGSAAGAGGLRIVIPADAGHRAVPSVTVLDESGLASPATRHARAGSGTYAELARMSPSSPTAGPGLGLLPSPTSPAGSAPWSRPGSAPGSAPGSPAAGRRSPASSSVPRDDRTLGTILLGLQRCVGRMGADASARPALLEAARADLALAVSRLDALHRVDAARVVPAVLQAADRAPFPGAKDLRRDCEAMLAQIRNRDGDGDGDGDAPGSTGSSVHWGVLGLLERRVSRAQLALALEFALESLDERVVGVRNNAAHPANDMPSLLEWEIESLRRIPGADARRRKADALEVLCVCATREPYWALTHDARTRLKALRKELGIERPALEIEAHARHQRAVSGSGMEALLAVGGGGGGGTGAGADGLRRSRSLGSRPPKPGKLGSGQASPQLGVPTTPTGRVRGKGHWTPRGSPMSNRII